jgi:hypothetical protein
MPAGDRRSDTNRLATVLAIDVRSALERKLYWLKLTAMLLVVVPFVISLVLIADPDFRNKAIRGEADGRTCVFKLTPQSLAKLNREIRDALQAQTSRLERLEDGYGKVELRKALAGIAGIGDEDIEAVLFHCTWSVGERKKAETQMVSSANAIGILLACLLLG